MSKRLTIIASVALLALLCLTATAQTYSIRVNVNIRAQPSLDGAWLETVPAGTTLEVLGELNRWLRVNRHGEAWMASWLAHDRVATPATQPVSDNCCGIDRQCRSDQEWIVGWHAFRIGHCQAPAVITQTETPTQTQSGSNVNNCCFTGWSCHSEQEWKTGYHAYQHGQCAAGPNLPTQSQPAPSSHGRVRITQLTAGFAALVNRGFELLRTKAPQWYNFAVNGLNEVRENHHDGFVDTPSAIAHYHHAPHYNRPIIPEDDKTMAGFLVHEACHVYQYREGRNDEPQWKQEKECVEKEMDAGLLFGSPPHHLSSWREFLADPQNQDLWWW